MERKHVYQVVAFIELPSTTICRADFIALDEGGLTAATFPAGQALYHLVCSFSIAYDRYECICVRSREDYPNCLHQARHFAVESLKKRVGNFSKEVTVEETILLVRVDLRTATMSPMA